MPSVSALLRAHAHGDKGSLQALGVALSEALTAPTAMPVTPVEVEAEAGMRGWDEPGTWQEVRAARDFGDLTPAEYDYLQAAVEALTQEAPS